jgi:hypothetical protein
MNKKEQIEKKRRKDGYEESEEKEEWRRKGE